MAKKKAKKVVKKSKSKKTLPVFDFDTHMVDMQDKQDKSMLDELYRQLFGLDHWFFICDPDDQRFPVMWKFADQGDEAVLLSFTTPEKAAQFAKDNELSDAKGRVGIMPAEIDEAVEWMGKDLLEDGISYACFNLGTKNFPLYFKDVLKLNKKFKPIAKHP